MSPCFQGDPGPGFWAKEHGPYASQEECDADCSIKGACCDGESCTLKTKCECRRTPGAYFLGVGTTCDDEPCPCTPVETLCEQDWDSITWTADITDLVVQCTPHGIPPGLFPDNTFGRVIVSETQLNRSGLCLVANEYVGNGWTTRGCGVSAQGDDAAVLTLTACEQSDGSIRYDLFAFAASSADEKSGDSFNGFSFSKTLPSSTAACPDELVFTVADLSSGFFSAANGLIDITGGEIRLQMQACSLEAENGNCGWWCDNVGARSQTPDSYDVEVTLNGQTATFSLGRLFPAGYGISGVSNSLQLVRLLAVFFNDCTDDLGTYRIRFTGLFYDAANGNALASFVAITEPIAAGTCCPEGVELTLTAAGFGEGQTVGSLTLLC